MITPKPKTIHPRIFNTTKGMARIVEHPIRCRIPNTTTSDGKSSHEAIVITAAKKRM